MLKSYEIKRRGKSLEFRAPGQEKFTLSVRIKQLEGRMDRNAELKTHIINYSKTQEIYKEYKKSRHKKEYCAAYTDELAKYEAAKAAFDTLNGKPIPKVAQLSEEYAALLAEKKRAMRNTRQRGKPHRKVCSQNKSYAS